MTSNPLRLNSPRFHDQILGCWMGKNVGGTLGGPLEKAWGEEEPLDVWWYPKLQEGGIPNDDLELQLIWLKALEEVGPQLTAADLAQYWLNHIGYDPDEYGLSKANLRRGLMPPVSGAYNNWFKDCMGCPIRSEIWACVAPGHPRLAVRYAYEDAICDHAGGESVYGEFFNVAIESAAFVVSDRDTLLNIGLSYLPGNCKTRSAIEAAMNAYKSGVTDWKEARRRVMAAAPSVIAQYSPINIGFQVVGWLYGENFGDAVCKAVNCGYDTDCTGATLGSILGILLGRAALPAKWIEPLGDSIAKGGLIHAYEDSRNPVPFDLHNLTARTIKQARRVLAYHGLLADDGSALTADVPDLYGDETALSLTRQSPMRINFAPAGATLKVGARGIFLNVHATCPVKTWVNGQIAGSAFAYLPLRPNYGASSPAGEPTPHAVVDLKPGWNEVLIKFVRGDSAPRFDAHFVLAERNWGAGNVDIGRTRFPWD